VDFENAYMIKNMYALFVVVTGYVKPIGWHYSYVRRFDWWGTCQLRKFMYDYS